jgi:hypothetical protein
VNKLVLEAVLRSTGGVSMQPYELDMVIMEFETPQVKGQLDFESFEREFNEFVNGKSLISAPA